MADAVPVSDVLCEAMEYLSKLGSNLRVRSENLKEKKIRKDKLKNAHAVLKAANKVLLICELSKKSIENVETGVKKVLTHMDEAKCSQNDRGKITNRKSSRSSTDVKYEYIHYGSRKLRIRNKVNVKHYTSVKVLAKEMSIKMQEKYPVYHDCKLYRMRNRKDDVSRLSENLSENENKDLESETDINSEKIDTLLEENSSHHAKTVKNSVTIKTCELLNNDDSNLNKNNLDNNESPKTCDKNLESPKEINDNDIEEGMSNSKKEKEHKRKKILSKPSKSSKYKLIYDSSDSDHKSKDKSNNISCEVTNKTDPKHNIITNQTSEKQEEIDENTISDVIKDSKEHTENSDNAGERTKSSLGKVKVKDKQPDSNSISKKSDSESELNDVDASENNKSSEPIKHVEDSDKEDEVSNSKNKPVVEDNNSNHGSTDSKPVIKCVNINKLLRPEKVPKIDENLIEIDSDDEDTDNFKIKKQKDTKQQEPKNERPTFKRKKIRSERKASRDSDKEYWEQKREEVRNFRSKKFVINVTRLPELNESYLRAHDLQRITHKGSVKCELQQSSQHRVENEAECDNSLKKKEMPKGATKLTASAEKVLSEETKVSCDINSVKNALLDDSDSDKSNKEVSVNSEKVKSLSGESDVEKQDNSTQISEENTCSKDASKSVGGEDNETKNDNHDSESLEQGKDDTVIQNEVNEKVKSSLLNDSTDENSKTPSKKRKRKSDSISPSKRKHIMESMHAKKMLLTYSSSSDTEDEQLKNALKEIRESLLKGASSDEEKPDSEIKKAKDTSDSEDSFGKIKKKKKKSQCTILSEEEAISKEDKETDSTTKDTISQPDEKNDESTNSSSLKMGRSKPKPGGSSSQLSDTQDSCFDKDIDGLTNLKSLTKKLRRRGSTSTDRTRSTRSRTSVRMSKPQISEEGFLKAESSSDAASIADSDVGEEVELPAVELSGGLNGDCIDHLAKDDLLDDSDSSNSHNNSSSQEVKKEEDSDEQDVKSKRRKAIAAISSDSEAGSSRKKDREGRERLSDFEDSEEESSEPAKRSKRKKKKGSDSDASAGSSDADSKKKRRRIKNIDDSEGSGSETENEGRNKHGRKNIRKVMSKNQLEEATKKAARQEKERIARIAERQKLYNNLQFDESGKPDEVVLDKVILDFDPDTKEPLIALDKGLVKKLKPHQANGIKFMWDACFESVKRIKKDKGSGCILAHCMGLGKTLQVVSLTHTLLTHSKLTGVNRVLVVCPLSTVLNWVNEFNIWLKHTEIDYDVDVYELSRYKQNSERAFQLQQWFNGGGVCVLGYEMFRNLSADNVKKFKKKMLKNFQESLVDPGPDLVVCDEGHLLKNEKTSLSQAMNRVKTLRRIVLTGTPLQNNLKEYYCMVQFVKPNLLGKYNEYLNRFVNPITNGQYTDSTEHDIRIMKRRSHVLHKMLDGAVQRRDYGVLAPFLPPKHEYVLFITLSEIQVKLYQHYLDNYSRRPLAGKSSGFLFPDFQSLQRIWTHPLVLKYNSVRYEIMQQKKREKEEEEESDNSLADFIDDDSTPEESSTEESTDDSSDMSDDSRKKSKKKKSAKKNKAKDSKVSTRRGTRANPVEAEEDASVVENDAPSRAENPTEWWMSLVTGDELEDLRHSHKLVLLFDILRQCDAIGDKLLVFSQSLYSLDLIEHFLEKVDEATQQGIVDEKLNGHVGSWSPGVDYFRLDGSTSCENRSIWCKNFNREDNPRARLFLISTRAGGLGINLVAANRVVIFDVSWNPSHDVQSIFRVYRFGQKKPCYIYRFLAMGTMEEKIYERQVTKQAISKRVIDEQQIDRHYAENDLAELYKFEPEPPSPRPIPPLPKDRLFAEMLKEHEAQIYRYHEHDSLLENKEEETLTEEERKAAWEDFENEKTRPPPPPMHYAGLLQQQQMTYAAMAAMLRKSMPNATDKQVNDLIPLILSSNPGMFGGYDYGLMQKMNEIYMHAQPGLMMNPGMMNPLMNPAAAGGMGMGGASGLQYDPPWQRQQQMRMQQLMQHQNQMGAKFYQGGLGSRDPVAMALQQQRAREMMLGERSRPRGRPPATPRASPADVVNLDSD